MKDYELRVWYGVLAPKATPPEQVARLRAEVRKVLALASTKDALDAMGMDLYDIPLEQFDTVMKSDRDKYTRIIKTANVKLN